jgi:hypothetical protein
MAGQAKYLVAHPNGEEVIEVRKGGKAPAFATWMVLDSGWEQVGWSYQATLADAVKKALPTQRAMGATVTATPVIRTGP